MPTRLQVVLSDSELAEIRQAAARERMTVAEWVRQALRRARREAGTPGTVVAEAAPHRYGLEPATAGPLEQLERALLELDGVDQAADAAWDEEIARRLADLRTGRARVVPGNEVLDRIDRTFGW